ncbi:hypothetical protein EBZ80_10500 [bacterium]|nr:hypothetical protein [bacterium]
MANYTFTAADITADASATIKNGTAGDTITAGQAVYLKLDDSRKVWRASKGAAASAIVAGIALNSASAGQPVFYCERGIVNVTSGQVAVGAVVVLSTAGGLSPAADLASGNRVCVVGVGLASNKILVNCSANRLISDGTVPA